jgi:hypothetical protein
LNFNNMSFTRLLVISHFMHVHATGKNHQTKNEQFSMNNRLKLRVCRAKK